MAECVDWMLDVVQISLATAPPTSVFLPAADWVEALLTGSLATALGVIAIALVGFLALFGRLEVRRAITVVIGCFVLFGAADIARGLLDLETSADVKSAPLPLPPTPPAPPSLPKPPVADDPFAGAAVPR